MLDRQKFYDTARVGMMVQGARCVKNPEASEASQGGCKYRSKGMKCAFGFNIPDDLYFPALDGTGGKNNQGYGVLADGTQAINVLKVHPLLCEHLGFDHAEILELSGRRPPVWASISPEPEGEPQTIEGDLGFVHALQSMPDGTDPFNWPRALVEFARKWGVNP